MPARLLTEQEYEKQSKWARLPGNVGNGGPFVWHMLHMLHSELHDAQALLAHCHTIYKLLERGQERMPRRLLSAVYQMARRRREDEFRFHDLPRSKDGLEVRLADDKWEVLGKDNTKPPVPCLADQGGLQWLKFLAEENCVNKENWQGTVKLSDDRDKYRLFWMWKSRGLRQWLRSFSRSSMPG